MARPKQGYSSRRVLITGGASGTGYAVGKALLEQGAGVVLGDIDRHELKQAAGRLKSPKVLTVDLDVTSPQSVRAAVARCRQALGGLDTLLNCAGVIRFTALDEVSDEEWDLVLDTNLKGVFLCCQAAAPLLRESGRGRIVTIASDAAQKGYPLISSYCASKSGLIGFSRAIAGELAPYKVTVNCVCPIGMSATKMGQQVLGWLGKTTGKSPDRILAARAESVPLGRLASTKDVVNAVMFFISDESSFLTGEALNVDGGNLNTAAIAGLDPPS